MTQHITCIQSETKEIFEMTEKRKIYTLVADDNGIHITKREHLLEDILYRLNMIYEYVDELEDSAQEINHKLNELIEKDEKKNHNPSKDYDSSIQF